MLVQWHQIQHIDARFKSAAASLQVSIYPKGGKNPYNQFLFPFDVRNGLLNSSNYSSRWDIWLPTRSGAYALIWKITNRFLTNSRRTNAVLNKLNNHTIPNTIAKSSDCSSLKIFATSTTIIVCPIDDMPKQNKNYNSPALTPLKGSNISVGKKMDERSKKNMVSIKSKWTLTSLMYIHTQQMLQHQLEQL